MKRTQISNHVGKGEDDDTSILHAIDQAVAPTNKPFASGFFEVGAKMWVTLNQIERGGDLI